MKTIQNKNKIRKKFTNFPMLFAFLMLFTLILFVTLSLKFVHAQSLPHNVQGYVFHSDGSTLAGGITVKSNNTQNGDYFITYTASSPPFFPFLGFYSDTIDGNDDDVINITAWNATYWNFNVTTLAPTTTYANITLSRIRGSEPNVTITSPANNSVRNTTDVFNVTANITILGNDATNCNATISFLSNAANITSDQNFTNLLGNINFQNSKTTTWNATGIKEGILDITVIAQCSSDDVILESYDSYTINISIRDTTRPVVNLLSPLNNTWLKKNNITFEYNVTENTGIGNCSLYFNDKLNQTSYNLKTDKLLNFTLNYTPEGNHNWYVSCFDNSSSFNEGNSSFRVANVDITKPNITLLSPLNNTLTRNRTIIFKYNVTDNFYSANCSLIVDDIIIQTNYSVNLNISNNFTQTLQPGSHLWQVNCTDNASSTGNSGFFNLTINASDLTLNSSDIVFSASTFVENQNITINATVFNTGTANADNVTVQFFENDPDVNGVQIGSNKTISITMNGNVTVNETYVTKIGKVDIFVIVDPPLASNGSIIELNESNNKANRSIEIVAYHIFYGGVISDIFLDTSSNKSVISWINSTNFEGNIFVADSDSDLDFNSLQALSRNTTNNLTMNDFEELDIALNSVNLSDSINRTYTENDVVKDTANFTVFGSSITDVPVVNSTNTSSFITGILWDTSDFNIIGFYNGSQDIAFVTNMNIKSVGTYGTYDYEIKVPANLRKYISPNALDSVTFYREII